MVFSNSCNKVGRWIADGTNEATVGKIVWNLRVRLRPEVITGIGYDKVRLPAIPLCDD
jgi:hypothetical protein